MYRGFYLYIYYLKAVLCSECNHRQIFNSVLHVIFSLHSVVFTFFIILLRSICEQFNVGRSTALYITRRVVRELIAPFIIKWSTNEQLNEVWTGFEIRVVFPKSLML